MVAILARNGRFAFERASGLLSEWVRVFEGLRGQGECSRHRLGALLRRVNLCHQPRSCGRVEGAGGAEAFAVEGGLVAGREVARGKSMWQIIA